MQSDKSADLSSWQCKKCGFENPIYIVKRETNTVLLCGNCREQFYIFDAKGCHQRPRYTTVDSVRLAHALR